MSRILELREKAKKQKKHIVLPEGEDPRVIRGAAYLADNGIAEVTLLGVLPEMKELASKEGVSLSGVDLVDPRRSEKKEEIVETYYGLRKSKGMAREEAEKAVLENFVLYGAIMTRLGYADGFVAGASHTTATIARAGIQCLTIDRNIGVVSSSFLMEIPNSSLGENGLFIYGDCAIIPYPKARQLAGIAIATSDLFAKIMGADPRVALLSYSTKGSASSDSIETVREALEKIKEKRPDILVDGELQVDAALVPEVAEIKSPGSDVGGKANVLIFPNLDAGNIAYKLTQRLCGARAVGPLMQGLDKPCSDLSRGCSWEDVVDTAAVTAIRAQEK
ncbi:MAG: phosphate acetyltransferase [Candidatus Omnitrophica bacterium]|nr:phosphate acetyltransferase [Candidatus Omnitrophota bacterium]